MNEKKYTRRLTGRLPGIFQGGENINHIFRSLGQEFALMEKATSILMRSRWYDLARGWNSDNASLTDKAAGELGRIGTLYGLEPEKAESANLFRKRLAAFVAVHRTGLGTAPAILHLAALEYRAVGPPEIKYEGNNVIGVLRVRDEKDRLQEVRLEVVDTPFTPATAFFENVKAGNELIVTNSGLDPSFPEITLHAAKTEVAIPVLSHVETGIMILFVGHIPSGSTLTLRHGKPPLLDGCPAKGTVFSADAYRFNDPGVCFYIPNSPEKQVTFSKYEPSRALPPLSPGENRWRYKTLNKAELEAFLADQPELSDNAPVENKAPPVRLGFSWKEITPATFTLRIPVSFLPPHVKDFAELAAGLKKALKYGRAAGVRSRLELVLPTRREEAALKERLAVRLDEHLSEPHKTESSFLPPSIKTGFQEKVAQHERFGTTGIFNNAYLDGATFAEDDNKEPES